MPPPPFIRWASCRNLVKCSWNIPRWNSVRTLAYTTCSNVADSSSDTSHPLEKLSKFNVINETLDQLKRERSSASLFLRKLKESGFKHDLETYMSVVRLLCHWDWGMDVRSNNLLNDVIDNTNWKVESFEISDDLFEVLMEEKLTIAVEVLVEVYARAGRFEEAIHTLSKMKSRGGLVVSTETCNFVIRELIKQGKVEMVESCYSQLKRNGLIPNVSTYAMLIKGLCSTGCLKEAEDVIEQMEEAGVKPNVFVYSRYIHGLCNEGKTELAFQLVKKLKESNKPVDAIAYGHVVIGFVKESKLQDAKDVLLDMKLRGVVPDKYSYGILIAEYCKKGDIDTALDLCKEMESRGIKTNRFIVRWTMEYLFDLGRLDEALCMFKHFMQQSGVILDGFSFGIVIAVACKLGKKDDVMQLLEEMIARKIKPMDDAMALLQEMEAGKFNPVVFMQQLASEPTGVKAEFSPANQKHQEQIDQKCKKKKDHFDQKTFAGFQDQLNMGQDEGVYGVLDEDDRQTIALHQLNSLNARHDVILKNLRRLMLFERNAKMKIRKADCDKDGGGSSLDKPVQFDEA